MRIPSQFSDDNLYRRQNRHRGQGDYRRVVQMLIALGLVLLMMQKASQPEIYESFFGALTPSRDLVTPRADSNSDRPADVALAMDPAVTSKVVDGAVWRSGDFDALYLFLADASNLSSATGPVVGILPLLQQPDVFRNKVVRSRGRVAHCERINAQENSQGITHYWQLWIRPADGADRPLVAIVNSVPPSVAAVGPDATDQNGPDVVIVGRFLKRLAYRSLAGADLAPVVVGKLITTDVLAQEARLPIAQRSTQIKPSLWLLIGLSVASGFGLAALVMWRTSVTANRTRQIRSSRSGSPLADIPLPNSAVSEEGSDL